MELNSMVYVMAIVSLASAFIVAEFARDKKIGYGNALVIGLFLTPAISLLCVVLSPAKGFLEAGISHADELAKFKALMEEGTITKDEFDQKKKQILGL